MKARRRVALLLRPCTTSASSPATPWTPTRPCPARTCSAPGRGPRPDPPRPAAPHATQGGLNHDPDSRGEPFRPHPLDEVLTMQPNRRDVMRAAAWTAAALFAGPAVAAADREPDEEDEDAVIERERRAERDRNAADYQLLLPSLWAATFALEQFADRHGDDRCPDDCDGGCAACQCHKAQGMYYALEGFEALIQGDATAETQQAALRDGRRGWRTFPDDALNVQTALSDLVEALDEVIVRHAECSCRLCRDACGQRFTVQLYTDVWECGLLVHDAETARAEVARRKQIRAALAASLGKV